MTATSEPASGRGAVEAVLGFGLTDEQWECVSAPLGPQVIVAGAGTGKTTVMAARVLWLVATGQVQPGAVLGLTFTRKAAGELSERVRSLLARWSARNGAPQPIEEPVTLTYHAFAGRLLGEHGLRIGLEPGPRHLDDPAVLQLAFSLVTQSPPPGPGTDLAGGVELPGAPALAAMVVALDAELAEQALGTDELRAFDAELIARISRAAKPVAAVARIGEVCLIRSHLADLVDQLRALKAQRGVDFSDQMRLGAQLLSGPGSGPVVQRLRATFGVVLLDEYQDTSIAQRTMLSRLFTGHPVTAVGDPLQAIYGWRSASVANIDQFGEHFAGPQGAPVARGSLSTNRRSGEEILAAANQVATNLRAAHPSVAPLRAPRRRPALVHAALLATHLDERAWLAEQVSQLVSSGTPPEHIAVLARVGAHLHPLAASLAAHGVPVSVAGRESLTSNPVVGEVVRTLLVLADPMANDALVGLLAGPRWRIGPADLGRLGDRARELAAAPGLASESPQLLMALANPGDRGYSAPALARFSELTQELAWLRGRTDRPLVEICLEVMELTGAELEAAFLPAAVGSRPLSQLLELVAGFADADGRSSLGAFAASLSLSAQLGEPRSVELDIVPQTVSLMTVHRAKGLEWPVVLLPGLVGGVFPNSKPSPRWPTRAQVVPVELRDDRQVLPRLAELTSAGLQRYRQSCQAHDRTGEDRLAYVAITRARDHLIGSGYWWGTGVRMRGPSPYLTALRDHDTAGGRMPWAAQPQSGPNGESPANPLLAAPIEVDWPSSASPGAAGALSWALGDPLEALAQVDRDIELLAGQARLRPVDAVPDPALPVALSASQAMELLGDPPQFVRDLLRPMPRRPSRAATLGTAFHQWVQSRLGQQTLLRPEDLPGAADDMLGAPELVALQEAFEALPYAKLVPHALEEEFTLALAGRIIRGRIDAVFRHDQPGGPGSWEVVDWKTSRSDRSDPVQLSLYRLAWANRVGVAPAAVDACFVHVLTGEVVRPDLLDAADLEALLDGAVAGLTGRGSQPPGRSDH